MESSIVKFHQEFYITTIQKLVFNLPHVRILGTYHHGNTWQEEFKKFSSLQDVLFRPDYAEPVVSRFAHLNKNEYYGGNMYVSIEGIGLEHFSDTYK